MAGKDIIIMKAKEFSRVSVIGNVINSKITQLEAANILSLSTRQIRRLAKGVKAQGGIAMMHKSRGRLSNRATDQGTKDKILSLYKSKYQGYGPTFTAEKLFEIDKIRIHPDTLRKWFLREDIAYKKRKSKKHRSWRPRKECFGQMTQMDGSHHKWFGEGASECVLMGYIDDATGRVFGSFYEYEGVMPAMDSFRRYIRRYGIPLSVYLDKHATYKSTKKPSLEDELNNIKALSQFERALKELGVDAIHADSPQAKGRIERSFKTHQDRLVKEMQLKKICTIKEANKFLNNYYIPKHNRKFAVKAVNSTDLHRLIPKGLDLDRIFCSKKKAALRNDFTIQYNNKFYQILDTIRAKEVTLEERLNGQLYIYHNDTQLRYKLIDKRPQKPKQPYKLRKPRYVPSKDHPYRLFRKFRIKKAS